MISLQCSDRLLEQKDQYPLQGYRVRIIWQRSIGIISSRGWSQISFKRLQILTLKFIGDNYPIALQILTLRVI